MIFNRFHHAFQKAVHSAALSGLYLQNLGSEVLAQEEVNGRILSQWKPCEDEKIMSATNANKMMPINIFLIMNIIYWCGTGCFITPR